MSHYTDHCTVEKCEAIPDCKVCGMRKHPMGRDPGAAAANGYCGHDCHGYRLDPPAGHLWPGELKRLREEASPVPRRAEGDE